MYVETSSLSSLEILLQIFKWANLAAGRMGYGDVQTPAAKERKSISATELHQCIRYIFLFKYSHFSYYVEVGGIWEQLFPLADMDVDGKT